MGNVLPLRCEQANIAYVEYFAWWRVFRWLRKKHPSEPIGIYEAGIAAGLGGLTMMVSSCLGPPKVKVERFRYRGTRILLPMDGIAGGSE